MAPVNLFFLVLLLTISDASANTILHATVWPDDITVIAGQDVSFQVTLNETITDNSAQSPIFEWLIEWDSVKNSTTYIEFERISDPEFAGHHGIYSTHYEVVSHASQSWTLTMAIDHVTLEDNGYFGVTIRMPGNDPRMPGNDPRNLPETRFRLTVVPIPTQDLECTHNAHYSSPEKDFLTCLSTAGGDDEARNSPTLGLVWYDGRDKQPIPGQYINNITIESADHNLQLASVNTVEIDSDPNLQRLFVCKAFPTELAAAEEEEDAQWSMMAKTCSIILNPDAPTAVTTLTTKNIVTSSSNDTTVIIVAAVIGTVICVLLLIVIMVQMRKPFSRLLAARHPDQNQQQGEVVTADAKETEHEYEIPAADDDIYVIAEIGQGHAVIADNRDDQPYYVNVDNRI